MGQNQSSPRTASSRKSNGRSARKNFSEEFKEGEDSTIPSFTGVLADEPDQSNVFTGCPKCQSANIDYNLEIPIKCGHSKCGHIFIPITEKPTPRELHLPLNLVEGSTYLEQPNGGASSSKYKTVNSIPELEDIIIYCEKSTITPDFRVDAEIDYGKIMKHLLMPYLQFRTRIFKEGISFKIGRDQEILFKVFACFPPFGRVSKRTVVKCYNSYDNSQTLHSVAVVPLAKLPSSLNSLTVKEKLSAKGVNLSVDQIFKLDTVHFRVLSCFPSNGLLGPQTQIDICKVKLQTIQYVSIEIRQSDIGRLFPEPCTLTDLEIANKIQDEWITPYFAGVYRYVEPGTTFRVADLECRIDHCSPDLGGLVKENTHFHVFIKHPSSISGGDGMLGVGMGEGGMNLTNPDEELKFEEPEAPSSAFRSHHQQLLQFQNPFAQRFVFSPDDLIFLQRRMLMNHLFQSSTTGAGGGHGHESGSRSAGNQQSNNSGMNMPSGGQSQQNPAPGGGASRRVVNLDELIDTSLLLSNILLASNSGAHRGRGLDLTGEGASRTQINCLPERKIDLKFLSEKSLVDEDYTKCMICLIDYEDEDTVRTMPCMHYFHKDCLDTWLVKKKYCPLCKTACDAGLSV